MYDKDIAVRGQDVKSVWLAWNLRVQVPDPTQREGIKGMVCVCVCLWADTSLPLFAAISSVFAPPSPPSRMRSAYEQ